MLTSYAQIRAEGNLPEKTVLDNVLEPHVNKAVIEMKKIITSSVYEEISEKNINDEDYQACSIAEANLTLYYALPSLNIETQGSGIVRTKGWDQSRSELLSQREVRDLQDHYRDVAMDLLKPFIPKPVSTEEEPADEIRGANYKLSAL